MEVPGKGFKTDPEITWLRNAPSGATPDPRKRVCCWGNPFSMTGLYEISGLVKDAQMRSAVEFPLPVAYLRFWQDDPLLEARMCIRVSGDPAAALPIIRTTIASIDPEVPVGSDAAHRSSPRRVQRRLMSFTVIAIWRIPAREAL